MRDIADKSIDMILCDLPYGTTACKWDTIIPFEPLWEQYKRVIKDDGAIVLTASQPFTSALVMSNPTMFRYCWVWNKEHGTDFQLAKLRPIRCHEDICVFSIAKTANGAKLNMKYNPQKTTLKKPVKSGGAPTSKLLHKNSMDRAGMVYLDKSPQTVICFNPVFNNPNSPRLHPTQKPVALFEYLVKTYTNEGDTVLDNCIGSGTTAIACLNTGRNYVGIERDEQYCKIAIERVEQHAIQTTLY